MIRTDWTARHARYTPHAPALVWAPTGRTYTYADLHEQGETLAHQLQREYNLEPGDRVGILAENSAEHVLLFVAAQKAGFVLVPLNYRLTASELQYLVDDSAPSVLFVGDAQAATARALRLNAPVQPLSDVSALVVEAPRTPARRDASPTLTDPLMILYTSGTTGRPKGAIISHGMLFWNAVNTEMRLDLTSADRSFNAAPFYHTGGWNVLLTPFLLHGATTHLYPDFDADTLLRDCDAEAYTILWGVPIRQGFGMTEVGVNCFSLPARDALRKIGSIGFPNFYIDTKVVDEDGADVGPGTPGELLMRGPVVTPGYWQDEEATATAIDPDGWFHTGDLVEVDDEGYFFVVGRKKEMYISGGENVYPAEIEAALHEYDGVEEAAVVGVPDDQWGEVGAAFVSGTQLDAEALRTHCETHLARYKVPKYIEIRDTLPKGHSGKIQKTALQEQFLASAE